MIGPLDDQFEALTGLPATRFRWIVAIVALGGLGLVVGLRLAGG